ncbi:hypothetical protein Trydic_g20058 [Trypoxylus dichotomus]
MFTAIILHRGQFADIGSNALEAVISVSTTKNPMALEELSVALDVDRYTVVKPLHTLGIIQKAGSWKRLGKQQEPNAPLRIEGKFLDGDDEKATAKFLESQFSIKNTSSCRTVARVEAADNKFSRAIVEGDIDRGSIRHNKTLGVQGSTWNGWRSEQGAQNHRKSPGNPPNKNS